MAIGETNSHLVLNLSISRLFVPSRWLFGTLVSPSRPGCWKCPIKTPPVRTKVGSVGVKSWHWRTKSVNLNFFSPFSGLKSCHKQKSTLKGCKSAGVQSQRCISLVSQLITWLQTKRPQMCHCGHSWCLMIFIWSEKPPGVSVVF